MDANTKYFLIKTKHSIKKAQSSPDLCVVLTSLQLGKFFLYWIINLKRDGGISTLIHTAAWQALIGEQMQQIVGFSLSIQVDAHQHGDARKYPVCIFLLVKTSCGCFNCVQVLPRWSHMTPKNPGCLLVVLEKCGKDRQKEGSLFSVCVSVDI